MKDPRVNDITPEKLAELRKDAEEVQKLWKARRRGNDSMQADADILLALLDHIEGLRGSREFYRRRCELLQKWQHKMRDPERTIVCDILANASTMPEGGRYDIAAAPEQTGDDPNAVDTLLRGIGLDPDLCRTDGGNLNPFRTLAMLEAATTEESSAVQHTDNEGEPPPAREG